MLITFDPNKIDPNLVEKYMNFEYTWDENGRVTTESIEEYNVVNDEFHKAVYGEPSDPQIRFNESLWLGQVSWIKASLEDPYRWIPRSVMSINNFYIQRNGVVIIDKDIIPAITTAFNLPHDSFYERERAGKGRERGVANARTVKKFLMQHEGEHSFVTSW